MLTASSTMKLSVKQSQLMTMLFVVGQSVPITFDKLVPRMDMVRTSGIGRTPDVRFRPSFTGWKARVLLECGESLAAATVVDLLHRAGSVGIGEWRPEKSGTYGTFRVSRMIDAPAEAADVEAECSSPIPGWTIPEWALDAEIDMKLLKKLVGADATGDEEPEESGEAGVKEAVS